MKKNPQIRARRRQLHDVQATEYEAELKLKGHYPSSALTALTDPIKFGLEKRRAASARERAEQALLDALKGKK